MSGVDYLVVIALFAWAVYRRQHDLPLWPQRPRGDGPQTDLDDVLDALEVRHGHAAQKALLAANRHDLAGALRWYAAAQALAETLYDLTGETLWRQAQTSYGTLLADHTRALGTSAAPTRVMPVTRPDPEPPVLANPQDDLIQRIMQQLKCSRPVAEQLAARDQAGRNTA